MAILLLTFKPPSPLLCSGILTAHKDSPCPEKKRSLPWVEEDREQSVQLGEREREPRRKLKKSRGLAGANTLGAMAKTLLSP
jgi:hypothetical protein